MTTPPRFDLCGSDGLVVSILDAIASHHSLTRKQILGRKRHSKFIWPRHLAIWLALKLLPVHRGNRRWLCQLFHRDPATISHAVQSAQNFIDTQPRAAAEANHWLKHFQSVSQSDY